MLPCKTKGNQLGERERELEHLFPFAPPPPPREPQCRFPPPARLTNVLVEPRSGPNSPRVLPVPRDRTKKRNPNVRRFFFRRPKGIQKSGAHPFTTFLVQKITKQPGPRAGRPPHRLGRIEIYRMCVVERGLGGRKPRRPRGKGGSVLAILPES